MENLYQEKFDNLPPGVTQKHLDEGFEEEEIEMPIELQDLGKKGNAERIINWIIWGNDEGRHSLEADSSGF